MTHVNAFLEGLALDDTGNEAPSKCVPTVIKSAKSSNARLEHPEHG